MKVCGASMSELRDSDLRSLCVDKGTTPRRVRYLHEYLRITPMQPQMLEQFSFSFFA